ncbi:MAG: cyclase family protein [Anaerolineales bacterium]|nr:cyclase family protein [Anaerolineales bacterium]
MPLIDITRTLSPSIAVWPGDTPFLLQTMMAKAAGQSVNLTTLTLSAHTGTHADAPYHFDETGMRMEQVDLEHYWGLAQVVTVDRSSGPLTPEDFSHVDFSRASRLLVRSVAGPIDAGVFPSAIVYPSPALADELARYGIVLYGADTPSMDAIDSTTLPGHHALHRNGIAILENLYLYGVADGLYELVAFPLKIQGGDGSPVRAVLKTL